jgi:hypothetical protein
MLDVERPRPNHTICEARHNCLYNGVTRQIVMVVAREVSENHGYTVRMG